MLVVAIRPHGGITTLSGKATLSRGLSQPQITPVARLGRALVAEHQAEFSFRVQQLLVQLRAATRLQTTTEPLETAPAPRDNSEGVGPAARIGGTEPRRVASLIK